MRQYLRVLPGEISALALIALLGTGSLACSSGAGGGGGGDSCLKGVYDCLAASGDCLLSSSDSGVVTVTWPGGASVVGPTGLYSFDAHGPGGDVCFQRAQDGQAILITSSDGSFRIQRSGDGSVSVTCPDGAVQEHPAGEFPADAPGIDPDVFISCRVAGICSQDSDCAADEVCCGGGCEQGERCPGTCEIDAHCGAGNRCCDGFCTSLPSCQVPCVSDFQCDDGVYCNGKETCVNRNCQVAAPIQCSDDLECTEDHCDEAGKRCVVTPRDELCAADERCRLEIGCEQVISCGSDADCDDQDVCTTGACQGGECAFSPVTGCCQVDEDCDDGAFCNGVELCVAHGCMSGQPPYCVDDVSCTMDACDVVRDECVFQPEHEACDSQETCDPVQGCVDGASCVNDEYEPNQTQDAATPLLINSPYMPYLCPGDTDWFEYELDREGVPALIVTFIPDYGALDVEVYGAGGPVGEPQGNPEQGVLIYGITQAAMGMTIWVNVRPATGQYTGEYMIIMVYDD